MVDPDILRAIELIDKRILSLSQARNQLAEAFGIGLTAVATIVPVPCTTHTPRKETLVKFLTENGPMPRTAIVARAGLPEGTVGYCLTDKRLFVKLQNGDYDVADRYRQALDPKSNPCESNGQAFLNPTADSEELERLTQD